MADPRREKMALAPGQCDSRRAPAWSMTVRSWFRLAQSHPTYTASPLLLQSAVGGEAMPESHCSAFERQVLSAGPLTSANPGSDGLKLAERQGNEVISRSPP